MKSPLKIFIILFTVMFSTTSFAEWTMVSVNEDSSAIFYLDFERIRESDGYVYYWQLTDYTKEPVVDRFFSSKGYFEGDCKLFRFRDLSWYFHYEPMGVGTPEVLKNVPDQDWTYPPPKSVFEKVLTTVCNHIK